MASEIINTLYAMLREEGDEFQKKGEFEKAQATFESARVEFHRAGHKEGMAEASRRLGDLAMRQEKWEDALTHFNAALNDNPNNLDALIGRSEVFSHLGRLDEEKADLARVLELDPANPQVKRRMTQFSASADGVRDTETDKQKGTSASTPPQPQFWLVSINQHQCDWVSVSHNPGVKYTIKWRHSLDAGARENLRRARPGDVVLAYRPEAEHDSIAAIGSIKTEVGPDGNEIVIELEIIFDHPITREQLVEVVPVVNYAPGVHFGLFNPIDAEKWSFVRELILSNNPSLSLGKWPASSGVPRISRANLVKVALSGEMVRGKSARVNISIRNYSNFTWNKGDLVQISANANWQKPGLGRQEKIEWRAVIDRDVPVWDVWTASNLEFSVPDDYDETFTVKFDLGFRLPYQDEEAYWASWEFPDKQRIDESPVKREEVEEVQSPADSTKTAQQPDGGLENQQQAQQLPSIYEQAENSVERSAETPPPFPPQQPSTTPVFEGASQSAPSLPHQPAPSPSAAPAPQPIVILQRYEPPPADHKVSVEISPDTVKIENKNRRYYSPNRINQEELLALESLASPREYGEALFKAVFNDEETDTGGDGKTAFRGYVNAIEEAGDHNNLRFELSLDPAGRSGNTRVDIHEIWWELLQDPKSDAPLSVYESSPFYRLQGERPSPGAVDALPLKILVAICNPTTLGQAGSEVEKLTRLNIEQECDIIERALKRLEDSGLADYEIWRGEEGGEPVTFASLQQKLEEGYHALHLLAHGALSRKEKSYCLVMEDDDRGHDLIPAERFTSPMFKKSLRLIVLACCQSGDYNTGKAFQALGPRLVHQGVPAVVAMRDFVPITTAQLFTQHFYDDLARSGRVDMAMAATRFALHSHFKGGSKDWAIPVLLMCSDDGKLFNVDRQKAAQLEDLKPDVKTYNQIPGEDPAPRKLAQAFASDVRQFGADENTVSRLRNAVEAVLSGASLKAESKPIAEQQDRQTLSEIIKNRVRINSKALREYVETRGSRLELSDSVYQQVASALNTGKHVIFIGPPGTGKTSLAHGICEFAKEQGFTTGVMPATATADWSTFDTVGGYIPANDGTLQFRPGIFLRAIRDAEWLVIDEINRAEIDKAFGELFTALSGQRVDLPYWVGEKQVRILPPEKDFNQWWDSTLGAKSYDYVMHPNWRIVAAMNAYDKSYLYAMSFAFMRRFAFIDIDVPGKDGYHKLLERWMDEFGLPADGLRDPLRDALQKLIAAETELMRRRALGPAILRDVIRHIGDRRDHDDQADLCDLLCEAFLLHAAPQLDGIERNGIFGINRYLQDLFAEQKAMWTAVSARIRSLYPHITEKEWTDGQE